VPSGEKLIGVKGDYGVYHVDHKEKELLSTHLTEDQWNINCATWLAQASIA
jgi:hypothetical protein